MVIDSTFWRFGVCIFGSLEDKESGCIASEILKSRNATHLWSGATVTQKVVTMTEDWPGANH
jgi:hypothetical protein